MISSPWILRDLRKARDIAVAARLAAVEGRPDITEETREYAAALDGAAASCKAAVDCFDKAIRIGSEPKTSPARSGPTGDESHPSTPTQAESDRTSDSTHPED